MNNMRYIENYVHVNNKLRKAVLFGAVTAGVAAGAYIGIRKISQVIEDRKLSEYYEDEIEKVFQEKEKMRFYEDEFMRQEKKEKEDLEKAVDEFNSRRLKREEEPHSQSEDENIENKEVEKDLDFKEEKMKYNI